ncbi:sugar phosphotransferase [Nakamurella antarctica]|uniref:Sugar phosphotransferase n=1 Tax=Nakamurella antarctica TaxID=1902245 RepID=A0A3G8ZI40_9ACTN|nr:stealth family protein [Nakamurella antarctica]AZI56963.1 sugar phosphotransferase [Nakamurella antarctica]
MKSVAAEARSGAEEPSKLLQRDDIVMHQGRLTLVNSELTPQQAMIADLLAIKDVLDAGGFEYLLVRGNDERPVLAVNWRQRVAIMTALSASLANEPFYAKPADGKDKEPFLMSAGWPSERGRCRIFRLFRPRVELRGGLKYGASSGVQLEMWSMRKNSIIAPVDNSLTRKRVMRDEAPHTTVLKYGATWPTLENMFAEFATDITFDIDIVFSWVDGSSAEFQRARARRMDSYVVGEGDDADSRFRQLDELKYALRSIYLFAPWIRHIFIATDSPRPQWLDEHPKVTLVRGSDHFSNQNALPTHNSHAVESQLQHIVGLSEHFLYSNDDMFFGRPVRPEMFFSPGGLTKFLQAPLRIGVGDSDPQRSGYENAARVNRALLLHRFGKVTTRHLEHAATPLRKSVLVEMETEFAEDFARTQASKFRSATDISVTNSLYHYYALMTGRAVVQDRARLKYVDTTSTSGLRSLTGLLKSRSLDFFCLNDGSFPEVPEEERAATVRLFLDRYFPIPAPWEVPEAASELGLSPHTARH